MAEEHTVVIVKKLARFTLRVDGREQPIPVDETVYTHYTNQFKNKTDDQKKRRTTLFKLMEAAYKQGFSDGQNQTNS